MGGRGQRRCARPGSPGLEPGHLSRTLFPNMQSGIAFPLTAMLAVLTTSSMAVTMIAVIAPEAAPDRVANR